MARKVDPPQSLRDLAQRALDETGAESGRALATMSVQYGHPISQATINSMLAGTYAHKPSGDALRALARMAGVSEAEAFAAARRTARQPFALPESADELTPDQRDAVLHVIRAFVRTNNHQGPESPE